MSLHAEDEAAANSISVWYSLSSSNRWRHGPAAVATSTTLNERQCLPPPKETCGLSNTLSMLKAENFLAETDSSYFKGRPAPPPCRITIAARLIKNMFLIKTSLSPERSNVGARLGEALTLAARPASITDGN